MPRQDETTQPQIPQSREIDLNEFQSALDTWVDNQSGADRVERSGSQTYRNLVQGARRAFVINGYIDCTVEDILREANSSRATFYTHFGNKKMVFAAVVREHVLERVLRTQVINTESSDYRDKVRISIERFLGNYASTQDFSLIIEQVAHYDVDFRRVRLVIRDIFVRRIERGIIRQQVKERVGSSLDPHRAAVMILAMLTNMAQVEIAWRGNKPTPDLIDDMTEFWCRAIGLK